MATATRMRTSLGSRAYSDIVTVLPMQKTSFSLTWASNVATENAVLLAVLPWGRAALARGKRDEYCVKYSAG